MIILGAGINCWYHMDMSYRALIKMLMAASTISVVKPMSCCSLSSMILRRNWSKAAKFATGKREVRSDPWPDRAAYHPRAV
ncbi:hypothetical protein BG74_01085 [Sodalis-like endosymbiont of Proechinophthirus fluctus]|nr:hypothetical protein BG74_07065 [Sodalis-like endosymbiont of Proechinophthirus fluctus]KYP96957.1 hypothetical protein BG74_06675 [Sodalis-like endosymbiont of Proechinophthirus fluctus]KYP97712.1 hypothetical protein BG74_01085 [Sodalis-like endosymbiont of Proechinophthirus fluctus]